MKDEEEDGMMMMMMMKISRKPKLKLINYRGGSHRSVPRSISKNYLWSNVREQSDPSSLDIPIDPQVHKSHGYISKRVVDILRSWLQAHQGHPYPSEADKLLLSDQAGLTPLG
jgi:hypothetical protein